MTYGPKTTKILARHRLTDTSPGYMANMTSSERTAICGETVERKSGEHTPLVPRFSRFN